MAYVTDVKCKVCGETKYEVTDNSGVCAVCRHQIADRRRREHLAGLRGLTVEERLDRIEAALYDVRAEERLKRLENRSLPYA